MKSQKQTGAVLVVLLTAAGWATAAQIIETFDSVSSTSADGWAGNGNTGNGNSYGWSNSTHAGGPGGEAGGFFNHATVMSYYGVPLGNTYDLSATYHGTGCVAITSSGPVGVMNNYIAIGFLNTLRAGGSRQASLLGVTVQEQDATGQNWRGRGGITLDSGTRIDGSPGVWLMPTNYGGFFTFSFDYVPNGGNSSTGGVTAKMWKNGTLLSTMTASLTTAQRTSGATFNAFGLATGGLTDANDPNKFFYFYADNLSGSITGAPVPCVGALPSSVSSSAGQASQSVAVTVPGTMNAAGDAYVTVTSLNPAIAVPLGAVNGSLNLRFPAGNTNARSFTVSALSAGGTSFVLANTNGVCTSNSVSVTVSSAVNVRFESAALSGANTVSPALLPVVLSQVQTQGMTVSYSATGGTAIAGGADYLLNPGSLTFRPGETNQCIPITIINNDVPQANRTLIVTLSNPSPGLQLGSPSACTYTITNVPGPWGLKAAVSGANLLFSWPVYTTARYQLQYRPDLILPPTWTYVANVVVTNGNLVQALVSRSTHAGFFRLAAALSQGPFTAQGYSRQTIYHSPQTPGYTSWVGAWIMADDRLMTMCHQATGPIVGRTNAHYDYTGLALANVYVGSTNSGTNWTKTAEDAFSSNSDRAVWGGSHCALADGAILRAVDGSGLPSNNVPRRVFFQRSLDLGRTWGPPEIPPEPSRPAAYSNYIGDFADCITRIRRLSDGRLLATGVKRYDPSPATRMLGEPVLMFSGDNGTNWTQQTILLSGIQTNSGAWNEWDCAELPTGDFLGVFRRISPTNSSTQVRYQGRFHKTGSTWILDQYGPAPFAHSGHPELLVTREGAILHIATTGIHWTTDAGATWNLLSFTGQSSYASRYYPRSVQMSNGLICVFGHVGSDNYYGQLDQSVTMDCFRLQGQ